MKLLLTFTGAIAALIGSKSAFAEYTLNMTKGITDISQDIYWLHMMAFWVCVAIGVVVFGAMFYSIIAHRKSKGVKAANFHESTTVEFIWTGIPILILIAMAIPASKTLVDIEVLDKGEGKPDTVEDVTKVNISTEEGKEAYAQLIDVLVSEKLIKSEHSRGAKMSVVAGVGVPTQIAQILLKEGIEIVNEK